MAQSISIINKYNQGIKGVCNSSVQLRPAKQILIVEGKNDTDFYRKYITLNKTNIKSYHKDETFLASKFGFKGKIDAKKFIIELIKANINNKAINNGPKYTDCFGIVDRDYDDLKLYNNPKICKFLIETDGHDLETTLLKYDYENIKNQFDNDFNGGTQNKNSIFEQAIINASIIGKMRQLKKDNEKTPLRGKLTNNIAITFKEREQFGSDKQEDCYYSFVDSNLVLNINTYLGNKYNNTQIDELQSLLNLYTDKSLTYCRGHDVFNFLACFYKKRKLVSKLTAYTGVIKNMQLRDECEKKLITYFDDKLFLAQSPMAVFLSNL